MMEEADPTYDTDTVSVTSTVSSTKSETYNVKAILSETTTDEDGNNDVHYLIEWDSYPMHR
jgi:hypothetical protein